ncbi:hypothetical protein M8C21_003916 [Ambrosia artemisiifolia]|uniref:Uncharacterized protein n=1 Tax=Ambrosia artemisiifolia TaxID=4212 RepID=A0AAD5BUB6_AMBAR|nr:hypothetical protein M8C21_003916 [Ambrosia artemisiifolia]
MDKKSPSSPSPKTPPPVQPLMMNSPASASGSGKIGTPNRLSVPKAFKYPEMYKSPTDQIMSPVSKGLLARTKSLKSSTLLPPSSSRSQEHKVPCSRFQDVGALKI